jgi:hypothetical protein
MKRDWRISKLKDLSKLCLTLIVPVPVHSLVRLCLVESDQITAAEWTTPTRE